VPLVPSQYTFTAKDRGVHSFPITIRHAPPSGQSYFVQATDTARPSLAGQQVRFIRPGSATRIDMTSYDPNPRLVVGQVLPKSKIFVSAFDQYGNYSNDPSLDFDFSTIGNPDNYQDLVDYPSTVPLTGGQATMTVPTPGMVHTPGSVITTFYLKKPGTAGANLVYGSTDVNVVSTAPNLNTSTSGGYTVQDNGALTIISDNINITLPPSTYIVSSVDTVNQTIIAVNGSTTLTMGVVTPVSPVSGDLHLSSNYPQPGDVVTISGSTNGAFNPVLVIPGQGAVSYSDGPTTRFSPLVNVTGDLN
jgi:hypothetical protein